MANEKNKLIYETRIGLVKATVWKNDTENGGVRFSYKLKNSYRLPEEKREGKKDDGWRETEYFSNGDVLLAAKALNRAYDFVLDYTEEQEQGGE